MASLLLRRIIPLIVLTLVLTACATLRPPPITVGEKEPAQTITGYHDINSAVAALEKTSVRVFMHGKSIPVRTALAQLNRSRVVFVGEIHTHFQDHLVQLAVIHYLNNQDRRLAIGVEWFQQDVQSALDDYIAGRIDEADMLRRSKYFTRWRYDYRLYQPILEYARTHHIPIIALNAPAQITHVVGRDGLTALSPAQRASIPRHLDSTDPVYRRRIREAYVGHDTKRFTFENFLAVQTIWDETMAANAARYLQTHPDDRLVVLAGAGHADFPDGIPDRLNRRLAVARTIVATSDLPFRADEVEGKPDIVVTMPQLRLAPSGFLGVFVHTDGDHVTIDGVEKGKAAALAGARRGDQIISLQGKPIRSLADLKLALLHSRPGDDITMGVRRSRNGTSPNKVTLHLVLRGTDATP